MCFFVDILGGLIVSDLYWPAIISAQHSSINSADKGCQCGDYRINKPVERSHALGCTLNSYHLTCVSKSVVVSKFYFKDEVH